MRAGEAHPAPRARPGEVVAPRCTFVGGQDHEGAVTLLDGRALCAKHRVEVLTSRAERVGRASRAA